MRTVIESECSVYVAGHFGWWILVCFNLGCGSHVECNLHSLRSIYFFGFSIRIRNKESETVLGSNCKSNWKRLLNLKSLNFLLVFNDFHQHFKTLAQLMEFLMLEMTANQNFNVIFWKKNTCPMIDFMHSFGKKWNAVGFFISLFSYVHRPAISASFGGKEHFFEISHTSNRP